MQTLNRPAYLVSICFLLIVIYLFFTPVEEQVVGETVHAIYPHVRLRRDPPKSLREQNYDRAYLDPGEVWIVIDQAQAAGKTDHDLGLWLKIRHPHNGRERWVASWLVEPSVTVVTPVGTRTRRAGNIAVANARLALARNRDNLTALATILGAIGTFIGIVLTRTALRLQRAGASQNNP